MIEYHFAIVEQFNPSLDQQQYWSESSLPRLPLIHQQDLLHLAKEGPWLVSLEGNVLSQIEAIKSKLGLQSVQSWLSSYLPAPELSRHLGDALVAQAPNGRSVLLRSYCSKALPVLHARSDCDWHASLFGPINTWFIGDGTQILRYSGGGLTALPDYQPIILDEALLKSLSINQQALALLEELERSAAYIFKSSCHGDRLTQVEQALDASRESGLDHADDQLLFATLYLLDGKPLNHSDNWSTILKMANEQDIDLGQALEMTMDENLS
jgi:hypothetical protein|tara:strand:+ start:231 stop:1034 length:804 start_codon:yes stop_codon:yes gene_type:complete